MQRLVSLAEMGLLPDSLIRAGIRHLLARRLRQERRHPFSEGADRLAVFIESLRREPVAVDTAAANEQHYELPPEFFTTVLGTRRKYSSCWWPEGITTLDAAEDAMLNMAAERAGIRDGMRILDLGCGWGSFTLWAAQRFPGSRIVAVSNSAPQRGYIEGECRSRGYGNVEVLTADMNVFAAPGRFDRIVSVEMFEHMRNLPELMRRVSGWLEPDGKIFIHIFCNRESVYLFQTEGADDWMGRYFFTGGMMPSEALLPCLQEHLVLERFWRVNGVNYSRTLEAWLERMDAARERVMPLLRRVYGEADARRWYGRWRIFFLASSELFAYAGGDEWYVTHYLFRPRS